MPSPRKQTQHASRIGSIPRLAQNCLIDNDDRVRPQYAILRPLSSNRQRLLPCQSLCTLLRLLIRQRTLINIRRLYSKRNASFAQKILSSRRGRCKYKHGF